MHDVAVEDAADGVGDRLVVVVAVDQHGEEPGDAASRPDAGAGALEQARQLGEDGGRVALAGRRLAGGEADLALRHREAGDAVHQAEHVLPLVAEIFGDREGDIGRLAAHQRPLVGGRDDDDAAGEAFGAEIVGDELLDLAAALADEADHRDVGGGVAGKHREQHGFPDAGAGKNAHALAAAAGEERVEGAHAEVELALDAAAGVRRGGHATEGIGDVAGGAAAPCRRPARPAR